MSSPATRPSTLTTLRAALGGGLNAGGLAGLCDGVVAAVGIDSSLFLIRVQHQGIVEALTGGKAPWTSIGGLFGCLTAAVSIYALIGGAGGALIGLFLHRFLGRRDVVARRRLAFGLVLGVWLGVELYWWTRPVVFPGLSAVDPRRLAAAAVLLAVGLGLGSALVRLLVRVPEGVRAVGRIVTPAVVILGALFFFLDTGASANLGRVNERNRDLPNVLVFVVDALRWDTLSCAGSTEVSTPVIDRLAGEGVMFENAFVQAPFTWSSFGSWLTGKYPRRHGLVKMEPGVRMAPNLTFPLHLRQAKTDSGEQLEGEDWIGSAFMTGTLSHGSGLLSGFDVYFEALVGHELVDVHSQWSKFRSGLLPWLVKNKVSQRFDASLVATTARKWFAENADRRFVSMVHYYSTHTPYDPPDRLREVYCDPAYDGPIRKFDATVRYAVEDGKYTLTEADERQIRGLYLAGAAWADEMIGTVLDELEAQGVLDDTIVVVTSDHGEELGEHGLWEHNWMYQTNLRVPLIVRYPQGLPADVKIAGRVDSIDLVPTLCDLMGISQPTDPDLGDRGLVDGVSLLPLVNGEVEQVRDYSFAENGRFVSIQDGERKLIVRRWVVDEPEAWDLYLRAGGERLEGGEESVAEPPRFYDLTTDPDEHSNLLEGQGREAHFERATAYFEALRAWSDSMPIGQHMVLLSERDQHTEDMMEALGYRGGVGEEDEGDPGDGEEGQ